jgi:hypothetical protein
MTLALGLGVLAAGAPVLAAGPATVGLGTAASYAVLAGTPSITSTGTSTVHGNIGIHPAAAVTGFPPGTASGTIHKADAAALQAKADLAIAYDDASGRPTSATHTTLGGLTLVAGVYTAGGATLDLTGTLTLDAENNPDAVWILQATSDLVTASASVVHIINGGQACNVFWQVTSSATLGSGSTMRGTIMALSSITMAAGVTVEGRALARNGLVSMISDRISVPACVRGGSAATPSPGTPASGTPSSGTPPPTDTIRQPEPAGVGYGIAILFLLLLSGVLRLALGAPLLRNRRR